MYVKLLVNNVLKEYADLMKVNENKCWIKMIAVLH